MELLFHSLDNGIRLVHHPIAGMVAHCGLVINTGSRDEKETEHGMAHFIEHMLFKGTRKRKAFHILSRLDDAGGELNAYTTKEETTVHASFLKEDYEKAIDIITDITFNSLFPLKEIEKEKDVIIEEINSYRDNPAELIFDDFEEILFPGLPIGRNILGTPPVVKSFTQRSLKTFMAENYSTDQMVFCSVGNISDEKIVRLFKKYFGPVACKTNGRKPGKKQNSSIVNVTKNMDTWQNHCIIGNVAYDLRDKKRIGMFLLSNLLGGLGLNSRLNLSLREKNGFAYNVESGYNPYHDTGVFTIYFGTDSQNLEKSISITMKELSRLRNEKLGNIQLSKAKNQVKGYLARGYENHESLMLSLGKSLLIFDRIDMPEENYRLIDAVTASDLTEIASEIFEPASLSMLIYK
jgi:predicted Zn-dependent peptidase